MFKEIVLPVPYASTDVTLSTARSLDVIFDSIGTYLLSDVEPDCLRSMFSTAQEGPYEYNAVQLEKDDIVIDAGANIGEFSAYAGIKDITETCGSGFCAV